jgi:hypothetical protein
MVRSGFGTVSGHGGTLRRHRFAALSSVVFIGVAVLGGSTIRASAHTFGNPSTTPNPTSGPVGTMLHDTAHLNEDVTSDRSIKFQLFNNANCTAPAVLIDSEPAPKDDTAEDTGVDDVTTSMSYTATAPGTYQWVASIITPTGAVETHTNCGDEPVTITKATPTLSTQASGGGVIGSTAGDVATVNGGYFPGAASATVSFKVYGPFAAQNDITAQSCTPQNLAGAVGPLSADAGATIHHATYTFAPAFLPQAPGWYGFAAAYSGNANTISLSQSCGGQGEAVLVAKTTPSISTDAGANITVGGTLQDTATISNGDFPSNNIPAPGTVTFKLYKLPLGSQIHSNSCTVLVFTSTVSASRVNGTTASATSAAYAANTAATYAWVATYSGNANNGTVAGNCGDQHESANVNQATPEISTVASSGVTVGGAIHDAASVDGGYFPGAPNATVTFKLYGPFASVNDINAESCIAEGQNANLVTTLGPVPADSGATIHHAAFTSPNFTTSKAGVYEWVALYTGNANNTSDISHCGDKTESVIVNKAQPAISTTPSAGGTLGTSIGDAATVSGGFHPTGSVRFDLFSPADPTCAAAPAFSDTETIDAGGVAHSKVFASKTAGTYRWMATYLGDGNNLTVASACNAEKVVITTPPPSGGVQGITVVLPPNTGTQLPLRNGLALIFLGLGMAGITVLVPRRSVVADRVIAD